MAKLGSFTCRTWNRQGAALPQLFSCRHLPALGIAAFLAGCAAPPSPTTASNTSALPLPPPAPAFSLDDLSAAYRIAYREGFIAGGYYQRRVDLPHKTQAILAPGHIASQGLSTSSDVEVASNSIGKKATPQPVLNSLQPAQRFSVAGEAQPLQ